MIIRLLSVVALMFLLASTCMAQAGSCLVTRMGNGLTVILQENHDVDLVGVDIWVKAGSANETQENNGVSHFIEHLVFGATGKREPGDMDLEMESLGATLDARTSRDWAHFSTTVPSRYLPQALAVLADAMTNAQFRESDIAREKNVILNEIAQKRTNPTQVALDLVAAELYRGHPYGLPVEGAPESVGKITRDDVLNYYRKYYVAGNMAIALVGDIEPQAAVQEIGRAFQDLRRTPPHEPAAPSAAPPASRIDKNFRAPYNRAYLAIGFLGPAGSDYQDVCAVDVMFSYLGFGYRSWMSEDLKGNQRLASEVSVDFLTQRDRGPMTLIAATSNDKIDKARDAILDRLARLRKDGITDAELAVARRSLLGNFAFQNETYGGRANSLGFYYAVSSPDFASRYIECVQSVTNEDIVRAAQKYLDPDRAVVIVVGPSRGGSQ